MFPPIARANLFDLCLNPLWEEMRLVTPYKYYGLLQDTLSSHIKDKPEAHRKYMEAINAELEDEAFSSILNEDGEYHPRLLSIFYSRIRRRISAKVKKCNIKPVDYFNLDKIKSLTKNQRKIDIQDAVAEELTEVTTMHETLARHNLLHHLPTSELNTYIYDNTWFQYVNFDIFLEVLEVLTDAADKGNSLGNKVNSFIHPKVAPSTDTRDNGNHPFAPNGFQITGLVISFFYLLISIVTPLYKKYKLKLDPDKPLVNKWSLRYFIPSVVLFSIGVVALTVPVTGIWIGLAFAAYSLASNIFKVAVYFHYYCELKREIAENADKITDLETTRDALHGKIQELKQEHKRLVNAGDVDKATACAESIASLEKQHTAATIEWAAALSNKEELEVKRIRTLDKWSGLFNLARLTLACVAIAGAILVVNPATLPVGGVILFVTLCVGIVLVAGHYINKFNLIKKEKGLAKIKRDLYKPDEELDSSPRILKKLSGDNLVALETDKAKLPPAKSSQYTVTAKPKEKGFFQSLLPSATPHTQNNVDEDEAVNSVFGFGS